MVGEEEREVASNCGELVDSARRPLGEVEAEHCCELCATVIAKDEMPQCHEERIP